MYKWYEKFMNILYSLQIARLKIMGAKIGKGVRVYGWFSVSGDPKKLSIGDNVTINQGVFLNCRDELVIESNSRLSSYCKIYTASLTLDSFPRKHISKKTHIKSNVWIASGAIVSLGITIGEYSTLGAGSVAIKDIEPYSFYAGVPAKKILSISESK